MPLSQSERKEKHYGFMCAALPGILQMISKLAADRSENHTLALGAAVKDAADQCLAAFEACWEGEQEAKLTELKK